MAAVAQPLDEFLALYEPSDSVRCDACEFGIDDPSELVSVARSRECQTVDEECGRSGYACRSSGLEILLNEIGISSLADACDEGVSVEAELASDLGE